MKKHLSLFLLLFSLFLFPQKTYAKDITCIWTGSSVNAKTGNLIITTKINNYDPNATNYQLNIKKTFKNINDVAQSYTVNSTRDPNVVELTFTIPNYQVNKLNLNQEQDVAFEVIENKSEKYIEIQNSISEADNITIKAPKSDCDFRIRITQNIADAINDYQSVVTCEGPGDCPEGSTCLIRGSQGRTNICVDSNENVVGTGGDNTTLPDPTCNGGAGVKTALGCLPTEASALTEFLLTTGTSIGAGLAFILMLFGAFTLITSAGNPDALKKGKEIIVSALVGLLFIIFSVFLLKLIGVDIIKIPTLTSTINQDARPGGLGH